MLSSAFRLIVGHKTWTYLSWRLAPCEPRFDGEYKCCTCPTHLKPFSFILSLIDTTYNSGINSFLIAFHPSQYSHFSYPHLTHKLPFPMLTSAWLFHILKRKDKTFCIILKEYWLFILPEPLALKIRKQKAWKEGKAELARKMH